MPLAPATGNSTRLLAAVFSVLAARAAAQGALSTNLTAPFFSNVSLEHERAAGPSWSWGVRPYGAWAGETLWGKRTVTGPAGSEFAAVGLDAVVHWFPSRHALEGAWLGVEVGPAWAWASSPQGEDFRTGWGIGPIAGWNRTYGGRWFLSLVGGIGFPSIYARINGARVGAPGVIPKFRLSVGFVTP